MAAEEAREAVGLTVGFTCQRCGHPLKLHPSFDSLDSTVTADLTGKVSSFSRVSQDSSLQPEEEIYIPEALQDKTARLSDESSEDFDILQNPGIVPHSETLGYSIRVRGKLFDIMSDNSEVDHPLCEECTDTLLDCLDEQLKLTEGECKDYRELLEKLSVADPSAEEEKQVEEEVKELEAQEESLRRQLQETAARRAAIAKETEVEKRRLRDIRAQEDRFQTEYSEFKRQLFEFEDDHKSVENQVRYSSRMLDKLKKTNIFNTTFHIWHQGHFGTINGFRLGRLPNQPVDWNEINAAWGQTVLLLHALANKMGHTFQRYRLVPFGNKSYIESLNDKSKELPLYGTGGIKFFWDTKFDQGMVAFLDCLQQFKEAVELGDSGFNLPYRMEKGKIIDPSTGVSLSIKIQFNSEEQWTKALKFVLTNLKWGLAWVSSQFADA